MEAHCDQCGEEVDSCQTMPSPETGTGDLCPDCYEKACYKHQDRLGRAWIQQQLPSMAEFMGIYAAFCRISEEEAQLEGNCHAAAGALVKCLRQKKVECRLKRGHWLGGDVRPSRRDFIGQQHSWVQVAVPGNGIIFYADPTQYVFTGAEPCISISNEDDHRYDPGGYTLRQLAMGPRTMPAREGAAEITNLSEGARRKLGDLYGQRDWRRWTEAEMIVVANTDPRNLGSFAKEIFQKISQLGHRAWIPIDAREEVVEC